ncbi:RNA polymerase sigma24 factor [Sorangium cellulosum]|uniref:RNA polymerase sigma24 factor n=1 Tax=Sorangium cellulosum TaxID=56 RepID=A0A2L0EZE8_SORCE|nr:sigma-70 family RNA polymerase sigma factor [Sorangium cellulosum]AUX44682.1 RNA polymerase sigma24 factor [Sorangium cellulosum]
MEASTPHDTVLAAAARGDDGALELLVRAYHDRVYRFGLRVCRDAFDADDAVQEAFTKLARRPDVAGDPGVLSWLMTVVRNLCLRMLRPFARERARLGVRVDDADADAAPSAELDPQAALERWRLVRAVHEAIAGLEPPYREVLVLRDVEGLTGEEVCATLGLSEAAMKSRLHRARQAVRAEILRRDGPPAERGG